MKYFSVLTMLMSLVFSSVSSAEGAESSRWCNPDRTEDLRPALLSGILLANEAVAVAFTKARQEHGQIFVSGIVVRSFDGELQSDSSACIDLQFYGGDVFGSAGHILADIEQRQVGRGWSISVRNVQFQKGACVTPIAPNV